MQQQDTSPFPSAYSSGAVAPSRVVVLTGASSGIGRATALAYARAGNALVLVGRDADTLETVAEDCRAAGGQVMVAPADVSDTAAMQSVAEAAIERFGAIDVWINNVGVGVVGLFDQTPMEAHRRVIESNLIGHMNGAHAVIPHFRERRYGILINMISVGGWVSSPYAAAYTASKFGLRGFSESLRAELSDLPDVHVCEVYPTFVDTPGMSHGANYSGRQVKP
ncbi:MAG: SDR family oxidoreductase, partial [Comamonadaceae bacterium]